MPEQKKKSNVISITIQDKAALYASYMPFLTKGGLFIPTNKSYALGDRVRLIMSLMNEPEKQEVIGSVVWITPKGAHGVPGIGVEFLEQSTSVRVKIENYLAGMLERDTPTHTM